MHLFTAIATSLAVVPAVLAVQFNGQYTITSLKDGTVLGLDVLSKVVSVANARTKNSTWYISSGSASADFAWISNVKSDGVLTATNSFQATNDLDRSQALGLSFYSDTAGNRSQQAWRINPVNRDGQPQNTIFEIESAQFRGNVLDIRGDGNDTRQVLVYPRHNGDNQLWRITLSTIYDGAAV